MTTAQRSLLSFRGHPINDGTVYAADFVTDDSSGVLDTAVSSRAVETERPGNTPVHVRVQPDGSRIVVEVEILELTQANYNQIKAWFDPFGPEDYLVAIDGDGVQQRLLCICERFALVEGTSILKASLRSASGIWEATDDGDIEPADITDSGQEFTITHDGDHPSFPVLSFVPTSLKDSADSYPGRRRVTLAHRSELAPFADPNCPDGGPVDISEGAIASPGDDARVLLYSREQDRWVSGDKLWANLTLPPNTPQVMTLGLPIDADDTEISAGNPAGFGGLLEGPAFIVIGSERIMYTAKSADRRLLTDCVRGCGNTVAASHSADAPIYQVSQPYLDVLYGKDSPDDPPTDVDREPVIDLADSTNAQWKWTGHLYAPSTHRSGQWMPQGAGSEDGTTSAQHVRIDPASGVADFIFEDLLPAAGKPRFNNLAKDFPCGIAAGTGVLTLDFDVEASLLLQAFATDIDGNESRMITEFWSDGAQTSQGYDSGDVLKRLRLNCRIAAILGNVDIDASSLDMGSVTISSVLAKITDSQAADTTVTFDLALYVSFHFSLSKEAIIDGFIIGIDAATVSDTLSNQLATADEALMPFGFIFPDTISAAKLIFVPSPSPDGVPLAAGDYRWLFGGDSETWKGLFHVESTNANTWLGLDAQVPLFALDTHSVLLQIPEQSFFHQVGEGGNGVRQTPVFALVSRTSDPEADAPLQTGNQIKIDNPIVRFDDDTPRTPLVVVGNEEDCYLFGSLDGAATLRNETTGEWISFRFASALNHWPANVPGDNTWTWTDPDIHDGFGELTISGASRAKFL